MEDRAYCGAELDEVRRQQYSRRVAAVYVPVEHYCPFAAVLVGKLPHDFLPALEHGSGLRDKLPGVIGGYGAERVIHAQAAGVFMNVRKIGDLVENGETIATIRTPEGKDIPVTAQIPGILRGLLRSGYPVTLGFKIADIDPRREKLSNCFLISDKSRCIAGSVLELVCAQVWQ